MQVKIGELKKQDYSKAIQFARKGMHFDWYLDNKLLLHLYGRYFWYLEMGRATQIIAAYAGDELAGVLLAEIKGENKQYHSPWSAWYVKLFDFFQKILYKEGAGVYEKTNREMFLQYSRHNSPDGEIIFLAANPETKIKGVGSLLLEELELRERGKKLYLYTDDACTYQFYEHRGFVRACEKEVILNFGNKTVPLKCFLYSKIFK